MCRLIQKRVKYQPKSSIKMEEIKSKLEHIQNYCHSTPTLCLRVRIQRPQDAS